MVSATNRTVAYLAMRSAALATAGATGCGIVVGGGGGGGRRLLVSLWLSVEGAGTGTFVVTICGPHAASITSSAEIASTNERGRDFTLRGMRFEG
ncbi:MAG TPA: hypothetical protein VF929_00060 [Gemmatimonadaceae bacterium]